MTLIKDKDTGEYIESLLECFAAPTIKGLKSGTLINLCRQGDVRIAEVWRARKDGLLDRFGVEAFEFPPQPECTRQGCHAVLVLLYKKDLLARALFTPEADTILSPLGYDRSAPSVELYLEHLGKRFKNGFPHEIGLFLDYPPEDVRGFIQNRGRGSLATGYWKVYGNVKQARSTFQKFRRAEYDAARSLMRQANFQMQI